ncbi:hypothetical protein UM590_03515 [Staphylococcus aureus]|nr:hypothetical protein UM590_03515 [Staphylococcus aureus]
MHKKMQQNAKSKGATHVSEVTQAQNNADALNTAMTNLKNGILRSKYD